MTVMENSSNRVQVRDAEGNFLFRKEWIAQYAVIDGPMNKVALTVTSTPQLYQPDDGSSPRYIVNVKAILRKDLAKLKERFGGADYIRADELNDLFLSGTVWVNEGQTPEVPMKGEQVLCNIGHVYSPALDAEVLRITGLTVTPPQEAEKVDMLALFADDPDDVFAEATAETFEAAAKKN